MLFELDILRDDDRNPSENPDLSSAESGKKQWRSFADRDRAPELRALEKAEFLPEAVESAPDNRSRRSFLQVMGASVAMAGLAACRRPVETIVPYTRQPEEIIPGKPLYYATSMPFGNNVRPVLVESHEGRPTKIEGNPDHPFNRGVGATGLFEQASILTMFDPDRTRGPLKGNAAGSWAQYEELCRQWIRDAGTARIAVISGSSSSVSVNAAKQAFLARYPAGRWVTFDAVGDDEEAQGAQMVWGRPVRPVYEFASANVIVSLDADFLSHTDANSVHNSREFAASRRVLSSSDTMSRFYAVESGMTITGGMADHRLSLKSSEIGSFAAALAARFGIADAGQAAGSFASHPWVETLTKELEANRGSAIVLAGRNQPAVVHALCGLINEALGNIGTSVRLLDTGAEALPRQSDEMATLVADMNAGNIDAIVMFDVNPVYSAAVDLDFASALKKVPTSIHAGLLRDETARYSAWHLPLSHYLESWGDGRTYDGTLSVVQPLIAPLFDSRSQIEMLHVLTEGFEKSGYDIVRENWNTVTPDGDSWMKVLHDGFVADSAFSDATVGAGGSVAEAVAALAATATGEYEVVFRPSPTLLDGSYSNVSWMQELPDAVTKMVWDNAALMGPSTAEKLGVGYEYSGGNYLVDRVNIVVEGRELTLPVWVVPGYAEGSIVVYQGYGRNIASMREIRDIHFFDIDTDIYNMNGGPLANGVGGSAETLRTAAGWHFTGCTVARTGNRDYKIVTTQDHGSLDWGDSMGAIQTQQDRKIVRTATFAEYQEENAVIQEQKENKLPGAPETFEDYPELWAERHPTIQEETTSSIYHQYQWGMAIDLNTCTGCNACVVACQSENNIQVVGKDEVGRGREMSWIRIDRYFEGTPENPKMVLQPMMCVHCENAPCEAVCPVAATSHSPDGINEMTYNRCIGTRYCANNCPYKVRRFNYFNWTRDLPDTVRMTQNPDVTVRFRGVMEKCTYCVQRVRKAGIDARNAGRAIMDGEVIAACQQACPTQSIAFGNLNDEGSTVVARKGNDRNYDLLAELGVKPRTSYLGRLFNPNSDIENAG